MPRLEIDSTPFDLDTPHGRARAHVSEVSRPRAAMILGHGAGGGIAATDLVAARASALAQGLSVALVEQPYRVAGQRFWRTHFAAWSRSSAGGRPEPGSPVGPRRV